MNLKITILLASLLLSPFPGQAHELLPRNVVQFIEQHPNASAQEIQLFIRDNAPQLVTTMQNKEDVDLLIGKQKTSFWQNTGKFLALGVEHILSGPDHILFVLSLLLIVISVKEILQLTGTFTLAHTTTLLLAGLGILTLPSRLVEPIIAFSISYVALTSLWPRREKVHKNIWDTIGAVFFFGLFHGLGFAGLLKEIRVPVDRFVSSLIAFNIGIELGQILIIASTLPFLLYFRNYWWYPRLLKMSALVIAIIGIVWGIQRIVSS